ncbi:MAG: class I SAM-dependent methyltransferase [Peptococcaceae bacterium]
MQKIHLTREKETLLIPLYGKAKETQKGSPLIIDTKAVEMIKEIDYDFSALNIPGKTNLLMCLRAKLIDNFTGEFLALNTGSLALHLGCGLDSRYQRIGNCDVEWFDIDFKEVIDLKRLFFRENVKYHLLAASVTEAEWLTKIPAGKTQNIVIAEGLFMYLSPGDIKDLLTNLKARLGSYTLIFDAFSVYTAGKAGSHPSIKETGATIRWGIDDPEELTKWGIGIKFLAEKYFTANEELANLDFSSRIIFKILNFLPFIKKAQRLLIYRID